MNSIKDKIIQTNGGLKYKLPNIIENIGFDLFVNGYYEEVTINFILKKIPQNGTFVDVGANIGAISLPICKLRSDIVTIGIEASANVFNYLKYNFDLNNIKNAILINKAVNDVDGGKINFFSPVDFFGKGSVSPNYSNKGVEIETVTLPTLLNNLQIKDMNFLKVDVEGYEFYVFKGAEKLLIANNSPDILFEFLDWAEVKATNDAGCAQRLLVNYGYTLYLLKDDGTLKKMEKEIRNDSAMIYATKNSNGFSI